MGLKSRFPAMFMGGVLGVVVIAANFVKYAPLQSGTKTLMSWVVIVSGFNMLLGAVSMTIVHSKRIASKAATRDESFALLAFLFITAIAGVFYGRQSPVFAFIFTNVVQAAGATIYATTVYWMASAAYRTFRARNVTGAIVLISAFLIILGNTPASASISSLLPSISGWITGPPTAGAQRGFIVCGAIGAVSVGVGVLLGLERGNLGASQD